MKYLLSARFQRFKDELAQGEEGYLNYTAVKFGQQRYVQKCYGNTEYLLCPGEWRSRKLSKEKPFFICFRKSLVEQWEPAKYRRVEVILDRYQRLEADPVLRELPLHMACIKIYTG